MLNKECCKKCWDIYAEPFDTEYKRNALKWKRYDEKYWKEGMIDCPEKYIDFGKPFRSITDNPPSKCPYFLEHIL